MELKATLRDLCFACGVNGCTQASETAKRLLSEFTTDIHTDTLGNVWGILKSDVPSAPTVLLEAHIDEIGFVVTQVEENGFLRVAACGGVDNRALSAAAVTVLCDPPINGVFTSVPPHLSKKDSTLPEITERFIDIGIENCSRVEIGTRVAFRPHFEELLQERVCAKALDNRAGVAAILKALSLIKGAPLPVNVAVLFSVQEELGLRGAKTAAFALRPDAAIAVDVSFAYTPDASKHQCGILGKGVMLGISPILSSVVTDSLRNLASANDIPLQTEVVGGTTGTDADAMSITADGIPTGLLSIPLRYMHTPNEVVSLSDMEATAKLIAAYLQKGEVPQYA